MAGVALHTQWRSPSPLTGGNQEWDLAVLHKNQPSARVAPRTSVQSRPGPHASGPLGCRDSGASGQALGLELPCPPMRWGLRTGLGVGRPRPPLHVPCLSS